MNENMNEVMEQDIETLVIDGENCDVIDTDRSLRDVMSEHKVGTALIAGAAVGIGFAIKNRKKIMAGFKAAAGSFKEGYTSYVDDKADRKKKLADGKKIAWKSRKQKMDDSDPEVVDVEFREETEE